MNFNELAAASSETARDINRRIVLNLIRNRQPISRAEVARVSGLQRSTVSLITEELIQDKWVVEGSLGRLPRGRRPTFLQLNEQRRVICIDIRPSRTTIAVGDVNGVITSQEVIATPVDPDAAVKELVRITRSLMKASQETPFEGIGVSLPGRIDPATHALIFAPNLRWPIVDLKKPLEQGTGLEVELENAANACALAEIWFGESGAVRDLVAITVSEGIGAGIIAHGQLISGRSGMAGEFGHAPLDPAGPLCSCGNRGCWEVLASNRAALRYYFESRPQNGLAEHSFTFQDLLTLAEQGDVLSHRALQRMAVQLGRGTRMIVAGLAPQAITFIGEFTAAWDRFRPVIEAEVQAQSIAAGPTLLLAGQDGAAARVRGTIALVFQKHFGAPASARVQV